MMAASLKWVTEHIILMHNVKHIQFMPRPELTLCICHKSPFNDITNTYITGSFTFIPIGPQTLCKVCLKSLAILESRCVCNRTQLPICIVCINFFPRVSRDQSASCCLYENWSSLWNISRNRIRLITRKLHIYNHFSSS